MNWKHSYENLKPYEVVIRAYAPDNNNPAHKPAWFARLQKRKWKVWYHVNDEHNPDTVIATYVRAWRKNEWILSTWWAWCPSTVTNYNKHYFVWRDVNIIPWETIYWWDLTLLLPFVSSWKPLTLWFWENNYVWWNSDTFYLNSLQDIADYFQNNWLNPNYPAWYVLSIQWNNLILTWTWWGTEPYPLSIFYFGAYDQKNWVFVLPNDLDWYASFIDAITTPWTETLWECEVIEVKDWIFDCTTDEIFFVKSWTTTVLNWKYLWWSLQNWPRSQLPFTQWQRDINYVEFNTDW